MPSAYRYNRTTGLIRHARRTVGSVRPATAQGVTGFVGRIGQHQAVAADAVTAFRNVAALAMGFMNSAGLRQHNAAIRAANRVRRAENAARYYAGRRTPPVTTMSPEAMIEALQQGAIDAGETPLTADQIMASWIRRSS